MILEEIAGKTKLRVEESKKSISLEEMKRKAELLDSHTGFPFERELQEYLLFVR